MVQLGFTSILAANQDLEIFRLVHILEKTQVQVLILVSHPGSESQHSLVVAGIPASFGLLFDNC